MCCQRRFNLVSKLFTPTHNLPERERERERGEGGRSTAVSGKNGRLNKHSQKMSCAR